jgi:hypothetical protein
MARWEHRVEEKDNNVEYVLDEAATIKRKF